MEDVIAKIDRELIEAELTPEHLLRHTNKLDNEIYIIDHKCAPNTMREIGRLREIATSTSSTLWIPHAANL